MQNSIPADSEPMEELSRLRAECEALRAELARRDMAAALEQSQQEAAAAAAKQLLAKVESQRALLDTIIENLPVGIGIADAPSGQLVRINEQTRRIWRLDSMEVGDASGYGKYTGFHPDGREYASEDWQLVRALRGEVIHGEELRFVRGDGSSSYMRSNAAPVRDGDGNIVAAIVVIDDITERKQAEIEREAALEALRDSQEQLRQSAEAAEAAADQARQRTAELEAMLAAIPGGLVITDPDGRYLRVNETAKSLFDMTPDYEHALLDGRMRMRRFVLADGRPATSEDTPVWNALRGRTVRDKIIGMVRDDAVTWISCSAAPLWLPAADDAATPALSAEDGSARVGGAVISFSDVTELRTVQEQLRLRAEQLEAAQEEAEAAAEQARQRAAELDTVFAVMPHSLMVFEADGRIRRSNQAARELFAFTDDYIHSPADERLRMRVYTGANGEPWTPEQTPLARALRGEIVRDEIMSMRPPAGGPPVWLSVSAAPLRGPMGEIAGAVATHTDVTTLRTAQEKLEAANQELLVRAEQMRAAEEQAEQRAAELDVAFAAIPVGVAVYDTRGEIVRTNQRAEALMSFSPDYRQAPRAARVQTLPVAWPDRRPIAAGDRPVDRALRGETVREQTLAAYFGPTPTWLSISAAPIRSASGQLLGAVSSFADITPLQEARERLEQANEELEIRGEQLRQQSEELQARNARLTQLSAELEDERARLQVILEKMPAGVLVADAASGQLVLASEQTARLWRRTVPVPGSYGGYGDFPAFHADGRPIKPEERPVARATFQGEVVDGEEITIVRGDGTQGILLTNAAPIRNREGQVTGGVAILLDVTERKEMEKALRTARDELELRVQERTAELRAANEELHVREEETRRQAAHAEALAAVAARLSATLDLPAVLQAVCEEAARVLGVSTMTVALYGEEGDAFEKVFHFNVPSGLADGLQPMPRAHYEKVIRRSGPTQVIEDTRTLSGSPNARLFAEHNVRSVVGCSILLEGRPIGGLNIYVFDEPRRFTAGELGLLRGLGDQAALAIANARLYARLRQARDELEERVRERTRELGTVLDLSSHVTSNLALEPMLATFAASLRGLVDYASLTIYRLDGDDLAAVEYEGPADRAEALRTRVDVDESAGLRQVLAERRPLIVADMAGETAPAPDWRPAAHPSLPSQAGSVRSWLGVPLMVRDRLIGVVALTHDEPDHFTGRDAELALAYANHAAVAMENARLYDQAKELAAFHERERLARDLHDLVSQTLFSASLTADVLPKLYSRDPAHGQKLLDDLRRMNRGALAELRALLVELRPQALLEADLGTLLAQLVAAAAGRSETQIAMERESVFPLPPDVQVALYRIAQEALNNVAKHANAAHASVRLACTPGPGGQASRVVLSVADDGIGFDPKKVPGNSFGLSIMQERAAAIGAALRVRSRPGRGTTVAVTWPAGEE